MKGVSEQTENYVFMVATVLVDDAIWAIVVQTESKTGVADMSRRYLSDKYFDD